MAAEARDDHMLRRVAQMGKTHVFRTGKHRVSSVMEASKEKFGTQAASSAFVMRAGPNRWLVPSIDDRAKYAQVPGRQVPVGFARYAQPNVNPLHYRVYWLQGFRVMMPLSVRQPRAVLAYIYLYGPQGAGFARVGDTLVPAMLGPGDRRLLSQSAYDDLDERYPLSQ